MELLPNEIILNILKYSTLGQIIKISRSVPGFRQICDYAALVRHRKLYHGVIDEINAMFYSISLEHQNMSNTIDVMLCKNSLYEYKLVSIRRIGLKKTKYIYHTTHRTQTIDENSLITDIEFKTYNTYSEHLAVYIYGRTGFSQHDEIIEIKNPSKINITHSKSSPNTILYIQHTYNIFVHNRNLI